MFINSAKLILHGIRCENPALPSLRSASPDAFHGFVDFRTHARCLVDHNENLPVPSLKPNSLVGAESKGVPVRAGIEALLRQNSIRRGKPQRMARRFYRGSSYSLRADSASKLLMIGNDGL